MSLISILNFFATTSYTVHPYYLFCALELHHNTQKISYTPEKICNHFGSFLNNQGIDYFKKEEVELILIGEPLNLDNTPTHATPLVKKAILELEKKFPTIPVVTVDERYSSKNAVRAMVEMGMKKVDRRDKKNIDLVAATMLLQEYLSYRS